MADEDTSQSPAEKIASAEFAARPETAPSESAGATQAETQPIDEAQGKTAQIPASEPIGLESAFVDGPLPPAPEPIAPPPALTSSPQATPAQTGRDFLVKARATIQDRKRKKLEKILEALTAKGKITNDEVEKLLHVSDATATRYLSALEKEGKIKQVGKTGKAVEYTRI